MTEYIYTKFQSSFLKLPTFFRYYPEVYFRLSTEKDEYVSYQFYYDNNWCLEIGFVRLHPNEEIISEDEVNRILVQMELMR